uniref:Uncharacterized protein n=1 Tax=Aegilops tauschii subsp. strangulata TaxID=200361 RepID=A0A452ZCQ1_AEGTS
MTTAIISVPTGRWLRAAPPLPPLTGAPSMTGCRQVGQEPWDTSQASTHRTWNPCAHRGSTRTFSPSTNSPRQMAHTSSMTSPDPYTSTGRLLSTRLLMPLPPRLALRAVAPPSPAAAAAAPRPTYRSAHRASELSPMAKSSAKKSAARMITTLVSKGESGAAGGAAPPSCPWAWSRRAASPAAAMLDVGASESGRPMVKEVDQRERDDDDACPARSIRDEFARPPFQGIGTGLMPVVPATRVCHTLLWSWGIYKRARSRCAPPFLGSLRGCVL